MLPKKRHMLEERLHSLDLFYDELEKLSLLIPAAKIRLDSLQHSLSTSHRSSDHDIKVKDVTWGPPAAAEAQILLDRNVA